MIDVVKLALQAVARYQTGGVQLPQTLKEIAQLLGALESEITNVIGGGAGAAIIFRPGAATAPPYYATWSEVEAAVAAVDGDATLVFDNSLAPLVVPATANLDGHNLLVMEGGSNDIAGLGGSTIVTVQSGARFRRIREMTAALIFEGAIHTPVFDVENGRLLSLTFGAGLRLLAGSTASFWSVTPGFFGALRSDLGGGIDNIAAPLVPVVDASAAAGLALIVTRAINAQGGPNVIKGAGATPIFFIHDASTSQIAFPSYASGFQPLVVNSNDIFLDTADGVFYDDTRVAPPYIAAGDHAFNVQLALDAIKGRLSGNTLVFDPAIPVSLGNVYKTWPEVQAAGSAAHGPLTIMFMPGCVMTAPGLNYNDNLLLIGYGGFGPNPTPITTSGGWNMSIVNLEIRNLDVVVTNTGTAPFEGGNSGCQLTLSGTTRISGTPASVGPAISVHGSPGAPDAQRIILKDQARLITPSGGAPPVLGSGGLAGGAHVELFAYDQSAIEPNSMAIGNVEPTVARQSDGASISTTQPGVPFTVEVLERSTHPFGAASQLGPVLSSGVLVPGFTPGFALPSPGVGDDVGMVVACSETYSSLRVSFRQQPGNNPGSVVAFDLFVNGVLIASTGGLLATGGAIVPGSEVAPFSINVVPGDFVQVFVTVAGFNPGDPGVTSMCASVGLARGCWPMVASPHDAHREARPRIRREPSGDGVEVRSAGSVDDNEHVLAPVPILAEGSGEPRPRIAAVHGAGEGGEGAVPALLGDVAQVRGRATRVLAGGTAFPLRRSRAPRAR